jgi:hypothetical protein
MEHLATPSTEPPPWTSALLVDIGTLLQDIGDPSLFRREDDVPSQPAGLAKALDRIPADCPTVAPLQHPRKVNRAIATILPVLSSYADATRAGDSRRTDVGTPRDLRGSVRPVCHHPESARLGPPADART